MIKNIMFQQIVQGCQTEDLLKPTNCQRLIKNIISHQIVKDSELREALGSHAPYEICLQTAIELYLGDV